MKLPLLLLLLPFFTKAQEVNPVLSNDYLRLINKNGTSFKKAPGDSTNSLKKATLKLHQSYNGYSLRAIKIKDHRISLLPASGKTLMVSGSFATTVELKTINRQPALQATYVQGRSQNGVPVWQGPETGELFSYGPSIKAMEFDGANYAYDVNGRLVITGTGNGKTANTYKSTIFRTASLFSQSFNLQARYLVGGKQVLSGTLKWGQTGENIFIKNNKNTANNFSATVETLLKWLTVTGVYNSFQDRFSNNNRNGFLNKVYQHSLLTPISFDNAQGNRIGAMQRSYSYAADNPFFLLENNNSFSQLYKTGSFTLEKKQNALKFKISKSLQKVLQNSNEGYQPGTAFFQNGTGVLRNQSDLNYLLKGTASLDIPYDDGYFNSRIITNYIYTNNATNIQYSPGALYNYQRSSNDVSLGYLSTYQGSSIEAGLNLANKFYSSNTTASTRFFLPHISGFVKMDDMFNSRGMSAKLEASYNNFASELPVSNSFSQKGLLQYATQQAALFFPVMEVTGFDHLAAIQHKEWTARLEVAYRNNASFRAEVFKRITSDDIFPVYENGVLNLKNIAAHQNIGLEMEARISTYSKNLQTGYTLSFFTNRSKVTDIKEGFNFLPLAGFSNVHTSLVKGEVLDAIVGSRFLRDASNRIVIGPDGFPLIDPTPAVIGNPLPAFVVKESNSITYKKMSLNLDWEWEKGGQIWNGTGAMLDYYGRSKTSGNLRNVTNYVFDGVLTDGHPNTIPVSFYDPLLPLEKSRWVRYGPTGVAEEYIQKADAIRLNNIALSYKVSYRKYIRSIAFTLYATNIIIWTAYKGADPGRLLYDQPNTTGLDFFNLPSTKTIGCNISIQF